VLLGGLFSLSVDAGSIYLTKRRLQESVDLAALKAVTDPSNAATLAQSSVAANISAAYLTEPVAVASGRYPPTGFTLANIGTLPVNGRFEPGAAQPNALRVTARAKAPLFLTRIFFADDITVSAGATAFNQPLAQITVGTGLLAVDLAQSGANDALLSGLLGSSISLSAVSYQGLANANVRLFGFLDALATVTGTPAGDYEALLAANVDYSDLTSALISAVQADPDLAAVAGALVATLNTLGAQAGSTGSFALGDVLSIADEASAKAAGSKLNLFALLRASAEALNQSGGSTTSVDIPVTGGSIGLRLAVIEPTQMSAIGGEGISVESAQVRAYLEVNPIQSMNVLGIPVSIRFPIYFEAASGQATVTSIACSGPDTAMAQVGVSAQPGLASTTTADINTANLHQVAPLATQPALISNVAGLVRVTATGSWTISGAAQDLTFTAPFDASNTQRVPLASPLQSVLATLLASGSITVTVLGLPFPISIVTNQLAPILNAIAPVVDTVIDDLLEAMGIATAYMDVSIPYVRCSNPVLAQ
jgi:uncharacterized membrane protein